MTLRLFVQTPLVAGAEFALGATAARHAQVRRVQPGDALRLFDGQGGEWLAEVTVMTRNAVHVRLQQFVECDLELATDVALAVGVPAGERMDWLVEKATELGVARIQPLLCERSVLRVQGERAEKKREHWQAVAVAAAEQCGRTRVPHIEPVCDIQNFTAQHQPSAECWVLSLRDAAIAPQRVAPGRRLILLSGPEGGLTESEETAALDVGWQPVSLGPRTLRAETAPLAVLAWLGMGC